MEEMAVAWEEVASCSIFALMDTGAEQGHKYELLGSDLRSKSDRNIG